MIKKKFIIENFLSFKGIVMINSFILQNVTKFRTKSGKKTDDRISRY